MCFIVAREDVLQNGCIDDGHRCSPGSAVIECATVSFAIWNSKLLPAVLCSGRTHYVRQRNSVTSFTLAGPSIPGRDVNWLSDSGVDGELPIRFAAASTRACQTSQWGDD